MFFLFSQKRLKVGTSNFQQMKNGLSYLVDSFHEVFKWRAFKNLKKKYQTFGHKKNTPVSSKKKTQQMHSWQF